VELLRQRASDVMIVQGSGYAAEIGDPGVLNVVLLGALSMIMPFSPSVWEDAIKRSPAQKNPSADLAGFKRGRHAMLELLSAMPGEVGDEHCCDGDDCDNC
jgi:hypothetical protein